MHVPGMGITFRVDDVTPREVPPASTSLREHLAGRSPLALGGAERRVLAEATGDGLLSAVHHAYADHHRLVLTPDAFWLTIVRGVAHHVRRNTERLRSRLVRHEGTLLLEIEALDLRPEDPQWTERLVASLSSRIAEEVGAGPARLYVCDFSTTTALERTASEVLLLDVYSPYFEYRMGVICGIPEITLEGTPQDWRSIRSRLDVIEELGLTFWTRHLKPIVDRLVEAAEGRPDRAFFQRIYKPKEAYGPDQVTGWIGWLYPYIGGYAELDNPLLAYEIDAPLPASTDYRGDWAGPSIRPSDVPSLLGTCDVTVKDHGALHLEAGVGAVEVRADGSLCPAAVWMIFDGPSKRRGLIEEVARLNAVIDRVVATCPTTPGQPRASYGRPVAPTDDLGQLYARLETATIGAATLLPFETEYGASVRIEGTWTSKKGETQRTEVASLMPIFQLADGTVLAVGSVGWAALDGAKLSAVEESEWFGRHKWRAPYPVHASEIPIVATRLIDVLEHLLAGTPMPRLSTVQRRFEERG